MTMARQNGRPQGTRLELGISVSESTELGRLGLVEKHLRFTLGEVARAALNSGARMTYGGHLQRDGYTTFLVSEMERYARVNQALRLCISWHEHRSRTLDELNALELSLELKGEFIYLSEMGEPIDKAAGRSNDALCVEPESQSRALTGLREYLARATSARFFLGGKERGFAGRTPGLFEEAILAIRHNQPLYLAGGFGGAAASLSQIALGLDARWPPHAASAPPVDRGAAEGLEELREAILDAGWTASLNGLTEHENRRLATTHRPSEVASLVARGLQRIQAA